MSRTIKRGMGIDRYDPTKALLNEERMERVVQECFETNDFEGVAEVMQIYAEACSETENDPAS